MENENKTVPQEMEELMESSFEEIKTSDQTVEVMDEDFNEDAEYLFDDATVPYEEHEEQDIPCVWESEDGLNVAAIDVDTSVSFNRKKNIINTSRQWSVNDKMYRPVSNTVGRMKAGYYSFHCNPDMGFYFQEEDVSLNKLYFLPNNASETIYKDISDFWKLKERYDKYKRVYKRNYLLYSAPGTGKTSIINLMCKQLIEQYDGIVFMINDGNDLELSSNGLKIMHQIEPDRKMILLIEDIDNYISSYGGGRSTEAYLLQLLDGNIKVPNLVVIATTNYIERLQERFTNRPSRFSRVLEYPLPNEESRKIFIENTILPEDLKKIDINEWVEKTDGFTIDHINEVIMQHFVHGYSMEESFKTVRDMVNNNDTLKNRESVDTNKHTVGFATIEARPKKLSNNWNNGN